MTGGLYVHFPYCEHHCSYCDFVVATPRRIPQVRFTDAILAELALRASALGAPAETLYLGGGTPSLWDPEQLARVLKAVRESPGLVEGAEVTYILKARGPGTDRCWQGGAPDIPPQIDQVCLLWSEDDPG